MDFFRPHIWWNDRLRWYERAALGVWCLGQVVCGICVLVALWLVAATTFGPDQQSAAAALLLIGLAAMIVGRAMLALATRRRRWGRLRFF